MMHYKDMLVINTYLPYTMAVKFLEQNFFSTNSRFLIPLLRYIPTVLLHSVVSCSFLICIKIQILGNISFTVMNHCLGMFNCPPKIPN